MKKKWIIPAIIAVVLVVIDRIFSCNAYKRYGEGTGKAAG